MSVTSEITRIKARISDSYDACEDKGATIPSVKNSTNLPSCIASIPSGGDYKYYYKQITVTSAVSSGNYTLATAAELYSAGIAHTSGEQFPNKWTYCSLALVADDNLTHATKQLRGFFWFQKPVKYTTSTGYDYGCRIYHSNSTTSVSNSLITSNHTTSSSGTVYCNTSGNLIWVGSSSYVLSAGTYHLIIQVAGSTNEEIEWPNTSEEPEEEITE